MHTRGLITRIRAAMSAAGVEFAGFLFVDDTDLIALASTKTENANQVVARIQAAVRTWHGGLRASGGALKPEKCSWCIADYKWKEGQWYFTRLEDLPCDLLAPDLQGNLTSIERLDPSDAVKVVGVHQSLDGKMTAQVRALKDKADAWGEKIKSGWLPRNLAHQGRDNMIWASLKYPLPACNITEQEGTMITRELHKCLLPKMGAVCTYPLAYRHAPTSLQGLGFPLIYLEQAIGQLRQVLTHGAIDTTTGQLLRISLEQAQLEVGIGTPFLETSFDAYGFLLTDCWWKSVWEFIWKNNVKLSYDTQALPTLQRVGDSFIMELLCARADLTASELIACNRCRLSIEAITLADIASGSGKGITQAATTLQPVTDHPSKWIWPRERPCDKDIIAWQKGLRLISSPAFNFGRLYRLGNWISEPHKRWEWHYDPGSGLLYRHLANHWHEYTPSTIQATRHRFFTRSAVLSFPPPDLHRATAWLDQHQRAHFGGSAPDNIPAPPHFDSLRHLLDSWEDSWPLDDMTIPANLDSLVQAITDGTAHGGCDGSYMREQSPILGSAAWKVEDPASGQAIEGTVQTTGDTREVNAYRSELQGIHAILFAISGVCTFYKLTDGAITIGCDNKGGIIRSNGDWLKINQNTRHADLIRAIRRLKASLPIQVTFVHVGGHQDNTTAFQDLPRLAQLNIEMDLKAKARLQSLILNSSPPPSYCTAPF
jgi:hypothetical protein